MWEIGGIGGKSGEFGYWHLWGRMATGCLGRSRFQDESATPLHLCIVSAEDT
jgi:hypothetical protein